MTSRTFRVAVLLMAFVGGFAGSLAQRGRMRVGAQSYAVPFGWRTFSGVADNSTDNCAALQSAIDQAVADGGNIVFVPRGRYAFTCSPTTVEGVSAQIHLPCIPGTAVAGPWVTLRGSLPPNLSPWVVSSGGIVPTAGAVLRTTATSGAFIGGACATGWPFTMAMLGLNNLTLRSYDNPNVTMVEASNLAALDIDHVAIDTGVWMTDTFAEPTHSSAYGLKTPAANNGAYTRINSLLIAGAYTCLTIGEHTDADGLSTWGCLYAAEVKNNYHASSIRHWVDAHSRYGINVTASSTPHPALDIVQWDMERVDSGQQAGAPSWQIRQQDVVDASNLLYGTCRYRQVQANTGPIGSEFSKTGGTNFSCTDIGGF